MTTLGGPPRSPDTVLMKGAARGQLLGDPGHPALVLPMTLFPSPRHPAPCIHVSKAVATLVALCPLVPRVSDFKVQLPLPSWAARQHFTRDQITLEVFPYWTVLGTL